MNQSYLQPTGLLSDNILFSRSGKNGYAVWFTKAKIVDLFFVKELGILDGKYAVPPLLWKADSDELTVFALADNKRPGYKTPLFYAPFFNVHDRGNVCMGNVEIDIEDDASLEDFITAWQTYFFTSKFSHLLGNKSPVVGNIVQLWNGLHNTKKKFPMTQLIKHSMTLKQLIK
jgi:PRTRC genetic system protein B